MISLPLTANEQSQTNSDTDADREKCNDTFQTEQRNTNERKKKCINRFEIVQNGQNQANGDGFQFEFSLKTHRNRWLQHFSKPHLNYRQPNQEKKNI